MASTSTHLLRFSRHESSYLMRAASFASSSSRHLARPQTRSFASSLPHLAPRDDATALSSLDLGARNTGRIAAKDENGNPIGREPGPLYREWLEGEGRVFKEVKPHETNYMGGAVPFPLNPSFKPPPPLSDRLRNLIFTKWMESPKNNNPRALSIRYGRYPPSNSLL
ncbi:hypothetical protein DL93DRAFT_629249 [Clavulina sp. PMI_390]|nr:hypothetical protein DL93DRAFT_629249 [Clavulina sp. PMI_390]